ncbi:MAG: DUF11 domain-containing protein, partial [Verrucomicrobia bacterium]|nr:DUF11 domain-containing protein [Verrucomicrobiota bacterium]
MQASLNAIDAYRGYIGNEMRTVLSMIAGMDGTVIYYDHWEDGYEADITSPTQATTQIWGDGDSGTGIPPGFTQDVVNAGTLINLEATIDVTRSAIQIEYDGRDKVSATRPISMTRALYAIDPGEVLAEACGVFDVSLHGLMYRAPVGVGTGVGNGTNSMFSYSAFYIMGDRDHTLVELDKDNDGDFEEWRYLDAGESWFVNGGVVAGATVQGSKAFQCHLVTGDIGSTYEMRWYELWPEDKWGSDYYCLAGTREDGGNTHPALVYCFNPNTNAITVFYETRSSTGSFAVAAGVVSDGFTMPLDSGGRFYTTNADRFLGVLAFDTWVAGGVLYGYVQHCQRYDWGMGLIPRDTLTTMGICSWGPGHGTTADGTNGNPVWVMAVSNTTIYVDLDSDPTTGPLTDPLGNRYDFSTNVSYLESALIFDNTDGDQTGMRIYTLDGTQLTSGWGEDPVPSEPGNPYLDMGYGVLPFPTVLARKYATLFTDINTNGYPDPGDELEFMVDVINVGFATANAVIFRDDLPTNLTIYVNNSSELNGDPVPDDLPPRPTRFPFDGSGYDIGSIDIGETSTVRYVTEITETLPTNFLGYIHNNATVTGTNANWSAVGFTNILLGGLALYKTSSATNPLDPGALLVYTVTLVNTGQFTYTGVTLEDYLPLGVAYVSNSTVIRAPGGLTNTVWDRFNKPVFTNNNGTLSWLNHWQEFGESDGPASGKVRVTPDTNSVFMETYALVVCGSNAAAWRSADLSGHSAAWLSFKYRRDSLPDINRYVDVFISTNGWASSNFLGRFQGAATDTNFISTNVEISAYISTNTAIRFHSCSAPNMGLTNRVWFDDVKIEAAGSNVVFAGNPPPDLMEGLMLPPGTTIVAQLSVTVDDPPLSTQLVNTARARAQQYDVWLYATATNSVHATSGVSMVKGVTPAGLVAPGTNLAYTITIINTGNVSQTGITLNDTLPVGVTYVSGSAELSRNYLHTNTVQDLCSFKVYTNQDGLVDWSTAWTETGDDGYPTSGVIQVAVDNGIFPGHTYALTIAGPSASLQRSTDLRAGYTNAWLSFEHRRSDLDAGDTLTLQVSSNGGATWSAALVTLAGPGTDSSYATTNVDISTYISSNTAIRFLSSATVDATDLFWLDDILITYSGAPATNKLRGPPELLDGRYDLPPGQTMTVRLNALVDDPPASTQMVNTVCYQSDQHPDCLYAYATNHQDFSVGMTVAKTSSLAGADWPLYYTNTYTITLVNTGQIVQTGITVTDALPAGVSYVPGSAVVVAPGLVTNIVTNITATVITNTVRDEFNTRAYTNNDGTVNWAGNWVEEGDDGNPLLNDVVVSNRYNTYTLVTKDNNNGAYREVDLSGCTGAVFSFDWARFQLDAADYYAAYVSSNGGSSYSQLIQYNGTGGNDPALSSTNFDISAWISADTRIRFYSADGSVGDDEGMAWDNVQIQFTAPSAVTNFTTNVFWTAVTNAGGAPPPVASGYTLPTGQTMTVTLKVTADLPTTYTQFINTAYAYSLQQGELQAPATDHLVRVAVGDWVWYDANTNGVQDVGEQGISNVTVRLYAGTTNLVAVTNTSATGYYLFSGWPAGEYFVEFVKPSGYWFTAQYQGGDPALDSDADTTTGRTAITNLVSGTNLTLDAGLYVPPSAIGNWVWFDTNTNGIQDGGESGVTGIVVRLYNGSSNLLATTTNDASGYYSFTNLPPGNYFVEFAIPTQYVFTLVNQGGDDAVDSDADPVTGRTEIFALGTGTNDTRWDAGVIYPVQGLYITKTSDLAGCGNPGGTATYTIVVFNTNVFTQTGVTVSDPTPAGTTWLTNSIVIQAPSSGYTGTPPTLAYGYTLAAAQAMTVTVKYVISMPTASTQLLNTAYAYSAGNPPVEASVTNCLASADLAVEKTATDSEVIEVQVIEYIVTATNHGPDTATGVELTDILPEDVQYNSHSNGTYSSGSGIWTIGTLPSGGSTSLYINVTIREGTADSYITNGVCVTAADQYDPVSANNCTDNTIRVTMIVLGRFEGMNVDGQVSLEWETVAEIGTVGFHLYRRDPGGAETVRVTEDLLPSVVGAPQGGIYRFVDPTAAPGRTYLYELEEIEAGGHRIRYGPFEVRPSVGKAARVAKAAPAEPFTSEVRVSAFRE